MVWRRERLGGQCSDSGDEAAAEVRAYLGGRHTAEGVLGRPAVKEREKECEGPCRLSSGTAY